VDVIGPDGSEVLGRLDAYSGIDSGWWAWFCAACATVGGPRFRAVDRALRALAEHWDEAHGLDSTGPLPEPPAETGGADEPF
jgi:hypothetical protein